MSTSVLYHAFNLKGITYRARSFTGDVIEYFADVKEDIRCPKCGEEKYIGSSIISTVNPMLSPPTVTKWRWRSGY